MNAGYSVMGIGGLFFRARDPEALKAWYHTYFGMNRDDSPWQQEAGPTVFAPFAADTEYFPADHGWMLNLRVTGLDALITRLRDAGVEVITHPDWNGDYGHFARVHDPEGNPIELWEPPADEA
jgi:glyoxylase I family protein